MPNIRLPFMISILTALVFPILARADGTNQIVLDAQQTGLVFEGLGALSAGASSRLLIDYPEPQRGEILDFLFKPKFGAALQHLKVEIGGDVDSTDGTEPSIARTREEFTHPKPEYFQRGYEWWLMKEAKKRNPQIVFDILQWGAPGWIGDGKFYSQDNADFIVAFIKGAKQYHDLDIKYCGCWNEKPYDTSWLKLLRQTLNTNGLNQVQIVAADEVNKWTIADKMKNDTALRNAVQVIGSHYPEFKSTPVARSLSKPVWSSEDGPWSGKWNATLHGGLAQSFNRNFVLGKMTKTIIWSPITSYYDILPLPGSGLMRANQPWSGHYEVQPAIWITAHTTQFIEPGWRYLGTNACAMLPGGGSHVATLAPDGKNFSMVVETMGAKATQTLQIKLAGGLSTPAMHVWRSTAKEQFIRQEDMPVRDGAFLLNVEPEAIYSLTTTDGQQKGTTSIPPAQPLPLPYTENFDNYAVGATPKYLSDFFGAFEIAASSRGGNCLKQVITRRGVEWVGEFLPMTIVGSPEWSDYEVAVDVCLDFTKFVRLYGRVTLIPHGKKPAYGYFLRVGSDGMWQLVVNWDGIDKETDEKGFCRDVLLAGKVEFAPGSWHRFGLRMIRDRLTVLMDDKELGTITDDTYRNGLAVLGSCWEEVKFDNLSITATATSRALQPVKVTSSSDWSEEYAAPLAGDRNPDTRWNAKEGTTTGEWLCVDLGKPQKISEVSVQQFAKRIRAYRLQAFQNGNWIDIARGDATDRLTWTKSFTTVTAEQVRLIVDSTDGQTPSISELELFE
jgi:hypothetical protein